MLRNEKIAFGRKIVERTSSLSSALVCSCVGLKADQINSLRLSVRRAGGHVQMGANRVISKALEETKFNFLTGHLKGSNFVVFFDGSYDVIGVIKAINDELRKHKGKLEFKCCSLNGTELDLNSFKKIATIKTVAQLQSTFVSSLLLSAQYLQTVFARPSRSLVIAMESYYKSKEGQQ